MLLFSRFHPACIGMTIKEAKKLEHFFCQTCTAENGKMAENSHEATAQSEEKVNVVLWDCCLSLMQICFCYFKVTMHMGILLNNIT